MTTYFIPNRRFYALVKLLLIVLALLLFAAPALAQDVPPTDNLPVIPVIPLQDAWALLLAAIASVLTGLVASPVTLGLVALLKRFAPLDGIPANILQLIVAGIIAVLFWAAGFLGLDAQFRTVYGFLLSVLPALAGMFTNQVAAAVEYRAAKAYDVGFFGYQRPDRVHIKRAAAAKAANAPSSHDAVRS